MDDLDDLASLPALQRRLDSLGGGQEFTIPHTAAVRLFGHDDLGARRIVNFAIGHGCTAEQRQDSVIFHKTALASR